MQTLAQGLQMTDKLVYEFSLNYYDYRVDVLDDEMILKVYRRETPGTLSMDLKAWAKGKGVPSQQ